MGAQAGFADGNAVIRNSADQFERCFDAHGERSEVAVVYADDAGAGGESAVELIGSVNLDERLHANLTAQGDEVAQQRIFKYRDDEEKAVCVVGAGFPDLPGIEDKILAQNRELDRLAGVAEILQRATEKLAFGQNGEGGSPRGLQSLGEGRGIEEIAKDTARRRGRFEFGKNIQRIATKGCGKIAERSGSLHAVLQRGLRQDAFAVIDLGAARFENASKDGSRVRLSRHSRKFVC